MLGLHANPAHNGGPLERAETAAGKVKTLQIVAHRLVWKDNHGAKRRDRLSNLAICKIGDRDLAHEAAKKTARRKILKITLIVIHIFFDYRVNSSTRKMGRQP